MRNDILIIIPARGGSKRLSGKNIKELCGKPLIGYSIDVARAITNDENICVSTDDVNIIDVVEKYGLKVPFVRPDVLSSDTATTSDVLIHAIDFYEKQGKHFSKLLLLQPTSPLRKIEEVREALSLYSDDIDMVVSVRESNVSKILCEENNDGFLDLSLRKSSIIGAFPTLYEYNGAIYVININSLKEKGMSGFTRRVKYVMTKESSIDIDDIYDFMLAEAIMNKMKHKQL
ncbi:MAG: acylneuraminate cytidylyltransferase family protein [Bacteroidales bacterium]|nr:acylneuraminate cytidylyltransferase family protein [Bacteroidales bacterium]